MRIWSLRQAPARRRVFGVYQEPGRSPDEADGATGKVATASALRREVADATPERHGLHGSRVCPADP